MEPILSLFHHIHHKNGEHKVHHCGGKHVETDPNVDYSIEHCSCGKHRIDKESAVGHATSENLKPVEVEIQFTEKCPDGGWHIESDIKSDK
tara:strand:+ start:60 stop:332 length:273 start_codon:yes stop_codon:yes gene_type:complete